MCPWDPNDLELIITDFIQCCTLYRYKNRKTLLKNKLTRLNVLNWCRIIIVILITKNNFILKMQLKKNLKFLLTIKFY